MVCVFVYGLRHGRARRDLNWGPVRKTTLRVAATWQAAVEPAQLGSGGGTFFNFLPLQDNRVS